MVDETGPAFVSFAGGAFSGRVDSQLRESAQQTWYNLVSVDAGPLSVGATIGASQTSQAAGYQIQSAVTNFTTVTPGVTGNGNTPTAAAVLPQTSRPFPFTGLLLYIANNGANPLNLFPSLGDAGGTINGASSVVLGVATITALTSITPGVWFADGIGEGASGSIATAVSQGNVASSGTTSATATQITQALVNANSGGASPAGVTLPPAKAGLQIAVANNLPASAVLTVYANGSDTVNGAASTTVATATILLFYCFVNGAWLTK